VGVLRLDLAYDGTRFRGWARQPHQRTVEGALLEALAPLLGARPRLSAAGRTDAGVHARGQVVSFEAPDGLDPARVQRAVNAQLAPKVVVTRARRAAPGFDARLSATGREYRYRIDTEGWPDPFTSSFVWHRPGELPLGPMRRAARDLTGRHDFGSFARARPGQRSMVRNLRRLSVSRSGALVVVTAEANGFLQQMVRSLVGTLVDVAEGRLEADSMPTILEARSRGAAGRLAPPRGLTLERVRYGR
jgi:tRNA pseudouridine38-40 synthase